jgi:trans-aconitate methyltransferase|tara:strand:+ start:365 stop:928 length:564 start_codon:yes stop_codon:yes gene_type:complete
MVLPDTAYLRTPMRSTHPLDVTAYNDDSDMANDKQFKVNTKFIATRGVKEYRASISDWIDKNDVVLEIGCEWGATTTLLARHCKEVLGTDVSPVCIERARERHPDLQFDVLDAFDVLSALKLGKKFTKIYIDMSGFSGYRSLLDTISLLTMYATVLRPEAIVIKSGALKNFAANSIAWRPNDNVAGA